MVYGAKRNETLQKPGHLAGCSGADPHNSPTSASLGHFSTQDLRTVPTKYKGFCAKLGPRGKSRYLQGLLDSTKKNRGSHAFFRDNWP